MGSSISGTTLTHTSTFTAPVISTSFITMSSMYGTSGVGGSILADVYQINNTIQAGVLCISNFNNLNFTNIVGSNSYRLNGVSTNQMSTPIVSTTVFTADYISTNSIVCNNTYVTNLSSLNMIGSTLFLTNNTTNSTLYSSTVNVNALTFVTLNNTAPLNSLSTNVVFGDQMTANTLTVSTGGFSTLMGSTLNTTIYTGNMGYFSTLVGSTVNTFTVIALSTLYASTLYGSSFVTSTLTASTVNGVVANGSTFILTQLSSGITNVSTFYGGVLTFSTVATSTMLGSSMNIVVQRGSSIVASTMSGQTIQFSTMSGSSLVGAQLSTSIGVFSTMIGSSLTTSTLSASSFLVSTISGSTFTASTLTTSTMSISSLLTSTIYVMNPSVSTFVISTFSQPTMNVSTLILPTTTLLGNTMSTLGINALLVSSINGIAVSTGGAGSNTTAGYRFTTMPSITTGTNNTAIGYQALYADTSGSWNTAIGASTLSTVTTGSYNTAIGTSAGCLTGFNGSYCTYLGYAAVPSGTGVVNEHVLGGASMMGGTNVGNGSNTMVLGNPSITQTGLYGNVGINTTTPTSTLTVNGSYSQTGGNASITNSVAGESASIWLTNDNVKGAGFIMNSAGKLTDGGSRMATLRNDNGGLRLQAAGGYNNAQGITMVGSTVGINKANPTKELDVTGNSAVVGTAVFSTINYSGSIIYNGSPLSITSQWTNTAGVINFTGNVGIGNTSPGSNALSVTGTLAVSNNLTVNASFTTLNTFNNTVLCDILTTQGAIMNCGDLRTNQIVCNGSIALNSGSSFGVVSAGNIQVNTINGNTNFVQSPSSATWYLGSGFINWGTVYLTTGIWKLLQADQDNGFINTFMIQYAMWGFYGSYLAQSNIATWASLSDRRIKDNIEAVTNVLDRVNELEPVEYTLRSDPDGETHVGFIAQDVQRLFPLAVGDSGVTPPAGDDDSPLLSLSMISLMPYYVSAFQELQNMITSQEAEIVQLQAEEQLCKEEWNQLQTELRIRLAY